MNNKFRLICFLLVSLLLCLSSCSPCYKATKIRRKAGKTSGAERHRLEGQAASFEAACLKKRDDKYDSKLRKQYEAMENKARN